MSPLCRTFIHWFVDKSHQSSSLSTKVEGRGAESNNQLPNRFSHFKVGVCSLARWNCRVMGIDFFPALSDSTVAWYFIHQIAGDGWRVYLPPMCPICLCVRMSKRINKLIPFVMIEFQLLECGIPWHGKINFEWQQFVSFNSIAIVSSSSEQRHNNLIDWLGIPLGVDDSNAIFK